jgi:hypothetical protein
VASKEPPRLTTDQDRATFEADDLLAAEIASLINRALTAPRHSSRKWREGVQCPLHSGLTEMEVDALMAWFGVIILVTMIWIVLDI